MNYFEFNPANYRQEFSHTINELSLSLQASEDEAAHNALQMIDAMQQSIDVMERIEADQHKMEHEPLESNDISQIGDYALTLLDELSVIAANRGLQQTMLLLHRLSLPVALWIAAHEGKINKLDIIVNAIASYANELTDAAQLEQLCNCMTTIVASVAAEISKDVEATNPMRPWRIFNINWGIVATRSHNAELIDEVYQQLMKNLPADIKNFFREGMQQMDVIGYPDHVRKVVEKYNRLVGNDESFH